jgi:hypothetical protein
MSLTAEQLRSALAKLNGKRDVRIKFDYAEPCVIAGALLVPVEADKIIKLTDGSREFLIDVDRVAWVEIG